MKKSYRPDDANLWSSLIDIIEKHGIAMAYAVAASFLLFVVFNDYKTDNQFRENEYISREKRITERVNSFDEALRKFSDTLEKIDQRIDDIEKKIDSN